MTQKKNANNIVASIKENKELLILILIFVIGEIAYIFNFSPIIIDGLILIVSLGYLVIKRRKFYQIKQLKKYLYKNINDTYIDNFKILDRDHGEQNSNHEFKRTFESISPVLASGALVVFSILLMMCLIQNKFINLIAEILTLVLIVVILCMFLFINIINHPKLLYWIYPLVLTGIVYALFYSSIQDKEEVEQFMIYLGAIILGIVIYYCLICSMPVYTIKKISATTMLGSVITAAVFDALSQLISAYTAQEYDNLSIEIEKKKLWKAVDEYNNEEEFGLIITTLTVFYLCGAYFVTKRLNKYQNKAEASWEELASNNNLTDKEIYEHLKVCCYYGKEFYKDLLFENPQYVKIVHKFE